MMFIRAGFFTPPPCNSARRLTNIAGLAVLLLAATPSLGEDTASGPVFPKTVIEYPLPAARETHELVPIDDGRMILVSQLTSSNIVKVQRNPTTGVVERTAGFTLKNLKAGLHGLRPSTKFPGKVWASLQFANELWLLEPHAEALEVEPEIRRSLQVPLPGRGPHVVMEYGDELWVTLKDSNHVLRINIDKPGEFRLYETLRKPIYVAKHEGSGAMYVSQDQSSQIMRIDPRTHVTRQIEIPEDRGTTPVGMITGPDGNVWFTLLGGQGTFGKIYKDSSIRWFELTSASGADAGLLHLDFEEVGPKQPPRLWLLGSSILNDSSVNALFQITLDDQYEAIDAQDTIILPTQYSKAHRVLVLPDSVFVTQLAVSMLLQHPIQPADTRRLIDQDSDPFSQFGYGIDKQGVEYAPPVQ